MLVGLPQNDLSDRRSVMDGAGQISRDPRTKHAVQTLGTRLSETKYTITVASRPLAKLERMRGIF